MVRDRWRSSWLGKGCGLCLGPPEEHPALGKETLATLTSLDIYPEGFV